MKKVSEWIAELGTHSIVDNDAAKTDFKKSTGEDACWHGGYDREAMQKQIDARGKGGSVSGPDGVMYVSVLDIAEACAYRYGDDNWRHGKYGMGSAVRACIDHIAKHGH